VALVAEITGLFVEQEADGAVGNQTPVLHGTRLKVGNGDQIHLGQRICDSEQFSEVFQCERGDRQGEFGLLGLSGENIDTASDGSRKVLGHGLDVLKLANNECDKLDKRSKDPRELR